MTNFTSICPNINLVFKQVRFTLLIHTHPHQTHTCINTYKHMHTLQSLFLSNCNDSSPLNYDNRIPWILTYLLTCAHRSQWSIGHQRPPAIALCSELLLSFRTSWSPAVSALLQCLASNCCEAGLSSSSPAGSRSGLGVWCWMLAS